MNTLNLLFSFKGKITRKPYWFLVIGAFSTIALSMFLRPSLIKLSDDLRIANDVVQMSIVIIFIAAQIKRCRDVGWPVWYSGISIIPYVDFLWWIVLGLIKGKEEKESISSESSVDDSNGKKQSCYGEEGYCDEDGNYHYYVDGYYVDGYDEYGYDDDGYDRDGYDRDGYDKKEDERNDYKKDEKPKSNDAFRTFLCPSCNQKIRVSLPLPKGIGKCTKCHMKFQLSFDDSGNLLVFSIKDEDTEKDDDGDELTIDKCYLILDIDKITATPKIIKIAYKKQIQKYHPDKIAHLGIEFRPIAEKKSKMINLAYEMLQR